MYIDVVSIVTICLSKLFAGDHELKRRQNSLASSIRSQVSAQISSEISSLEVQDGFTTPAAPSTTSIQTTEILSSVATTSTPSSILPTETTSPAASELSTFLTPESSFISQSPTQGRTRTTVASTLTTFLEPTASNSSSAPAISPKPAISPGEVAGLAIGVLLALVLVGALGWFLGRRTKRKGSETGSPASYVGDGPRELEGAEKAISELQSGVHSHEAHELGVSEYQELDSTANTGRAHELGYGR